MAKTKQNKNMKCIHMTKGYNFPNVRVVQGCCLYYALGLYAGQKHNITLKKSGGPGDELNMWVVGGEKGLR